MSVLRFLATVCLLIALIALVDDLTPTTVQETRYEGLVLSSISDHWQQVAPATYKSLETSVAGGQSGWLWTNIVGPLLAIPTCVMFGVLGVLAGYAGRRRVRVKIFAN